MLLSKIFTRPTTKDHFLYTKNLSELTVIQSNELNIAIHERKASEELSTSIDRLTKSSFTKLEFSLQLNLDTKITIKEKIMASLQQKDSLEELEPLYSDIESLAYLFGNICHADFLKLHLKTVTNDACAKFHIDGYNLRLLCTYHGLGTEWTYNDNVNRKYLGEGENEQIIKDWTCINRLNPFDVAILKGEIPMRRTGKGVVHRSPPIEHSGEKRLLLRIDF